MNRFPFGPTLDQFLSDAFEQVVVPAVRGTQAHRPAANVIEHEKVFQVQIVAPGFQKSDLKLALDKNILTISAEKAEAKADAEGTQWKQREFVLNSFARSFTLPESVDQDAIEAQMEHGILNIHLPKKATFTAEPKTISIL
jgi:HSP20 family protein